MPKPEQLIKSKEFFIQTRIATDLTNNPVTESLVPETSLYNSKKYKYRPQPDGGFARGLEIIFIFGAVAASTGIALIHQELIKPAIDRLTRLSLRS